MAIVTCCPSKGVARFSCAQAGCRTCLEALLLEHRGLVFLIVARQALGKADYPDLIQEGWIALWHAILHFDAGCGTAFSTYAGVAIRHRVWQAVARSLKAEGWLAKERAADSLDRLVENWQQKQIHQALGEELEILPPRLRQLIELHYGWTGAAELNLSEIGRSWHLTRERIRQLHNEALGLLRLPALSIRLRSLCERQERSHYRRALRQNHLRQHHS